MVLLIYRRRRDGRPS